MVCLQELKATQEAFPAGALRDAGYGAVWQGERSWNGVAILARGGEPIVTRRALPGDGSDRQARYIEAAVAGILIGCLYLPNGNPQPGPKFDYKLAWFERLIAHAATLLASNLPVVLAGDYNVVPTEADIYPTRSWDEGCAAAARQPRRLPTLARSGLGRCASRLPPGPRALHLLGLQARSLAARRRAEDRPPPAQPGAGGAPVRRRG